MSSHSGGDKGQRIMAEGTGFSTNLEKYSCSVAGETCTVTEASKNKVTI